MRVEPGVTVTLGEEQRQLVLLALAELAKARPGWDDALAGIAMLMDNPSPSGRPELYDAFRALNPAVRTGQ